MRCRGGGDRRRIRARRVGDGSRLCGAAVSDGYGTPRSHDGGGAGGAPELGGKVARAGAMTDDSKAEQGGLGLDRLSDEEFARFERLNAAYREKFGFPFIVCVRRHTRDSILRQFERRTHNDAAAELAAALAEIGFITR